MSTLRFAPALLALALAFPAAAENRGKPHDSYINRGHRGGPHAVPELDRTIAGSAAVLLVGGIFVILGRRRRTTQPL